MLLLVAIITNVLLVTKHYITYVLYADIEFLVLFSWQQRINSIENTKFARMFAFIIILFGEVNGNH
jgi:NADH:ubiquinone oxidoreductase subunit 3 (subunit A)